jgi:hypothetical protein
MTTFLPMVEARNDGSARDDSLGRTADEMFMARINR